MKINIKGAELKKYGGSFYLRVDPYFINSNQMKEGKKYDAVVTENETQTD